MADFELAKDKVMMGAERRSLILRDEEKRNTAYHEAGHAVVAALLDQADPVHKVTIIPRGQALGLTMQLPEDDKHTHTRAYLCDQLAILMGGRIAEELFMDHMTTGAGNDLREGHCPCPPDGLRMGHERHGAGDVRQAGRRSVPGARDHPAQKPYSEATAVRIDSRRCRVLLSRKAMTAPRQIIQDQLRRCSPGSPRRCWNCEVLERRRGDRPGGRNRNSPQLVRGSRHSG